MTQSVTKSTGQRADELISVSFNIAWLYDIITIHKSLHQAVLVYSAFTSVSVVFNVRPEKKPVRLAMSRKGVFLF